MKKLKVFILEDEDTPLNRLLSILKEYPKVIDIDAIVVARDYYQAQRLLINSEVNFDFSILDKIIPDGYTCFDLINNATKAKFGIIVLNSQDADSQKHFEQIKLLGGYLVVRKPYNEDDVAPLISEISRRINYTVKPVQYKPLWLEHVKGKKIPIEQKDIVYLSVNGNYTVVFYTSGLVVEKSAPISQQLKHFETILDPSFFVRISDKYIINRVQIVDYNDRILTMKGMFNSEKIVLHVPIDNISRLISLFSK